MPNINLLNNSQSIIYGKYFFNKFGITKINTLLKKLFSLIRKVILDLTQRSHWKINISLICVVYCIVTSLPNYLNFSENSLKKSPYYSTIIENYRALDKQADHPLQPQKVSIYSHSSKLAFRFVPTLFIHYLPAANLLTRMLCLYIINNIVGFIFFILLIRLVFTYSGDKLFSSLVAFNFAVLYTGKSFFHDTYLWNDGIAFTLLVASLLSRNALLILLCLLGAYFTDERAIFGGLLVYVYQKIANIDPAKRHSLIAFSDLPYIASFIVYGIIRLTLTYYLGLTTPSGSHSGVDLFIRFKGGHLFLINAVGFLLTYKLAWFLIILSGWWLRKFKLLLTIYGLGILAIIVISFSVEDLTRSLSYSFIALLVGFFLFYRNSSELAQTNRNYAVFSLLFLNFCIPTVSVMGNTIKMLPPIDRLISYIGIS